MFGKKTAEEVLKLFSMLSDEEKAKVLVELKQPEEEPPAEAEEQTENTAEENEAPAQTAEDGESDSADEQEPADGNEESPATEESEASEGTEAAAAPAAEATEETAAEEAAADAAPEAAPETAAETAEEVDYGEVTQALAARISALEGKLSEMEQRLADEVAKDNNQDFGSTPSLPTHSDENSRMAEVMNNYAGANARRYY